jgi:hypothetical protein
MNGNFNDYLKFNKMITPVIIQVLFWVLVAAAILLGLGALYAHQVVAAIAFIILGPIFARVWAEMVIIYFKIYDAVQTIAQKKTESTPSA